MIYLDNKTLLQELYIPRQEYISVTTGSGGTYAEGYADGVNDQKAKLASTAFTENGDYQRNDGWSAITVNVPQSGSVLESKEITVSQDVTIVVPTSGYDGFSAVTVDATEYGQTNYDSGFDDGFTDGYSSGSSEGYDSGYTEGYQSGSTDGYESGYTSGSTDGYESGYTEGYNSGYTSGETDGYNSGYTSGETDGFNSGYTSGETHQKSLLVSTAITQNGSYSRENGYSAITVNVPQTGSTAVLGVGSFSANGTYSASTDNLDGYSAITVNVPTSVETEIIMVTTGWCWFDTNYTMHYGDSIEIEHCTFGKNGIVQGRHQQYVGGNQSEVFRIGENENYLYLKYFNNFSSAGGVMPLPSSGSLIEDKTINFSSTGFVIDGNVITSYTTTELASTAHLVFFADTASGNDSITGQTAKMGIVRIYGSDGTLNATFKPMLDEFNVPFFKYVEEDIDIYAIGSGTPSYEIIDPSYVSGYTNGYTDGQNNIISTFTATTATTNGVYGSSANPLSSITVNVPQIGGVYGTKTITANGTYSASTDNFDGYSAITVNVPSSGERDIIICSSGQCWFDFDYTMVYGDYIDIEHCTFGKIGSHSGSSSHQQLIGGGTGEWFRIGQPNDNTIYFKYFNQNVYESTFSNDPFLNDNHLVFSKDAITIDGNVFTSYTTTDRSYEPIITVFANDSEGRDKIKNQTAKVGTIRVYGVDGTLKATFKPMLDEFNVPFFKYVEEDIDIYALGSGTPTYEFLPSSDYVSGYTDGYNSGYTSGYTDGQSAGSGYTINQLASRQYGITDPTINVDVEPYAFCESKASASVLNGHLTIGSGCTSIGIAAFFNSFITSVTFTTENTIRFVGDSNFSLSRIQGELELPQNIELNTASTVNSNGAFGGCHYITSLIAKCSVITPKCFSSCNRLNTLELHNVSSIGGYAFDGCSALTSIKIYDNVPSIDNSRSPFLNVASSGTVHYESGLNVSTWQNNTDLSGWTFVGDL